MSEYEYIDLMIGMREESGFHAMNFIAALIAYSILAYNAARKLTVLQATLVTTAYTLWLILPLGANVRAFLNLQALYAEFSTVFPESVFEIDDSGLGGYLIFFVGVAAWLVSVVFFVQQRKKATDDDC